MAELPQTPELLAVVRSSKGTLVVVKRPPRSTESDTRARDNFCEYLKADTNTSET
jgi:hypothetical protein